MYISTNCIEKPFTVRNKVTRNTLEYILHLCHGNGHFSERKQGNLSFHCPETSFTAITMCNLCRSCLAISTEMFIFIFSTRVFQLRNTNTDTFCAVFKMYHLGKRPLIFANDLSFNTESHSQLTTLLTSYKTL